MFTNPCRNFQSNLYYVHQSVHIKGVSNKFVLRTATCTYWRCLKQVCLTFTYCRSIKQNTPIYTYCGSLKQICLTYSYVHLVGVSNKFVLRTATCTLQESQKNLSYLQLRAHSRSLKQIFLTYSYVHILWESQKKLSYVHLRAHCRSLKQICFT